MAKSSVIITGNKSLNRMLQGLASNQARAFHRKALRNAAKVVLQEAKARTPVASGALRSSLTVKAIKRTRKGIGVRITQRSGNEFMGREFYGGFLEFGWRVGKRRGKKTQRDGNDSRRKVEGRWFMRSAGIAKEDEAIEVYETELGDLIRQEARK